MAKAPSDHHVSIAEIQMTDMDFCIVGESPLVPHAVSAKAKGDLLFPKPKKNAAEKATSMKHEPYEEFVDACYLFRDEDQTPTRLYMPAEAFHRAMAQAAIDMIGVKKAQIGRLTTVIGDRIAIFGIPEIYSTIVRSSDQNRTPDVRTLPILRRWAGSIRVQFVGSLIKQESIANLLGAAGVIIGVGDGRPEKGKKAFGKFRACANDDQEYLAIVKMGGRAAQDKALADPTPYDLETEKLLNWFSEEKTKRHAAPAPMPRKRRAEIQIATEGNGGRDHRDGP